MLQRMSLLLALFGHGRFGRRCPLLGEERKSHFRVVRAAFDPTETLAAPSGSAFDPGFSPYQHTCLNR
jgi:hypothetical protein